MSDTTQPHPLAGPEDDTAVEPPAGVHYEGPDAAEAAADEDADNGHKLVSEAGPEVVSKPADSAATVPMMLDRSLAGIGDTGDPVLLSAEQAQAFDAAGYASYLDNAAAHALGLEGDQSHVAPSVPPVAGQDAAPEPDAADDGPQGVVHADVADEDNADAEQPAEDADEVPVIDVTDPDNVPEGGTWDGDVFWPNGHPSEAAPAPLERPADDAARAEWAAYADGHGITYPKRATAERIREAVDEHQAPPESEDA